MTDNGLVRPLFDGPIDVVGDVHGEIGALRALIAGLGYDEDGGHRDGRRLVFLGDLTDRGPDSPAVVRLVGRLLDAGRAQCVLGNHDLNILLGKRKHGNAWFFGEAEALDRSGRVVPQVVADDEAREQTCALFRHLPLVLEREDLRIVHACWHPATVERVRHEDDAVRLLREAQARIEAAVDRFAQEQDVARLLEVLDLSAARARELFGTRGLGDATARKLARQNGNPIKVLTSGLERRAARTYHAAGKDRDEMRVPWWNEYADAVWCVFGHYGRVRLPGEECEPLFDDGRPYAGLGNGRALCIDYSVARRWAERFAGGPPYRTALAALRWPEKWLYFDTGRPVAIPDN